MQVRLAVAGAFHTKYMAPAAEKLQDALNSTSIVTPRIPVISNVDAAPHADPATIKAILAKQVRAAACARACVRGGACATGGAHQDGDGMQRQPERAHCRMAAPPPHPCLARTPRWPWRAQLTSPVQWETTLQTLLARGLTKSYEVGPGKVIAGIMKRINKKAEITNIIA
jgi:malonyl CoA-acyl carrier protein transacylase